MNKMICEKCGGEISGEFGGTISDCTNCRADVQLSPTKEETTSFKDAAPAPKSKKRVIFAACFFALLSLPLLYLAGLYWFIIRQPEGTSGSSIRMPDWNRPKPTPRPKTQSSVSPTEILQIEYTDSTYKAQYAGQYLSNYPLKNYFFRESKVTLINDGRAKKTFIQKEIVNLVGTPERSERYTGVFRPEEFAELARVFVENDFLGEEYSSTSAQSPVNQTITVVYLSSRRVRMFQAGDSGNDTPEAEAMLKAFKDLENKVDWQREK
jgi:hypothetical protein